MADTQHVRFLFDPSCPWAWRASRWVRAAAAVRPLQIEWDLLSLAYINRNNRHMSDEMRQQGEQRKPLIRLLALVRQQSNDDLDRLYTVLGEAVHEKHQDLYDEATWTAALALAGLDDDLLAKAHQRSQLDDELAQRYDVALNAGAIGTPTLYFNGGDAPYYGPVLDGVPTGENAAQLWDHLSWIATQPYFYELKRSRT